MTSVLLISTIITTVFSAIGGFFVGLKIKFCKCFCIQCECDNKTPPNTPNDENKKSFKNLFRKTKRKDEEIKHIE